MTALKTRQIFGSFASQYDMHRPDYPLHLWKEMEEKTKVDGLRYAYDVGSGTGRGAMGLAACGMQVTAVDSDKLMLAKLAKKVRHKKYNMRILQGKAENLEATTGSLDMITAFQSFHWFDALQSLQEFHRALRPSGCLFIAWNDRDLSCRVMSAVEEVIECANPHYKRDMKQNVLGKWKKVLTSNSLFNLIQYKEYDHYLYIQSQEAFLQHFLTMSFVKSCPDVCPEIMKISAGIEWPYRMPLLSRTFWLTRNHGDAACDK